MVHPHALCPTTSMAAAPSTVVTAGVGGGVVSSSLGTSTPASTGSVGGQSNGTTPRLVLPPGPSSVEPPPVLFPDMPLDAESSSGFGSSAPVTIPVPAPASFGDGSGHGAGLVGGSFGGTTGPFGSTSSATTPQLPFGSMAMSSSLPLPGMQSDQGFQQQHQHQQHFQQQQQLQQQHQQQQQQQLPSSLAMDGLFGASTGVSVSAMGTGSLPSALESTMPLSASLPSGGVPDMWGEPLSDPFCPSPDDDLWFGDTLGQNLYEPLRRGSTGGLGLAANAAARRRRRRSSQLSGLSLAGTDATGMVGRGGGGGLSGGSGSSTPVMFGAASNGGGPSAMLLGDDDDIDLAMDDADDATTSGFGNSNGTMGGGFDAGRRTGRVARNRRQPRHLRDHLVGFGLDNDYDDDEDDDDDEGDGDDDDAMSTGPDHAGPFQHRGAVSVPIPFPGGVLPGRQYAGGGQHHHLSGLQPELHVGSLPTSSALRSMLPRPSPGVARRVRSNTIIGFEQRASSSPSSAASSPAHYQHQGHHHRRHHEKKARAKPSHRSRAVASGGAPCACCGTTHTPMWRDGRDGIRLCNACGIRWQKYGIACPNCQYVPRKIENGSGECKRCGTPLPPPAPTRRRAGSAGSMPRK
eukprot:m.133775 g.133775  ORF g.133775 m.133775 type:complete len:632 (-) comp16895_c0_seq1:124-2019(-)